MVFEHWIDTDLMRLPTVKRIPGRVFTADSLANKVGVRVTRNGESVTLTGTVKAFIKRPDDETLEVTGTASGNTAYVILPSDAYIAHGMLGVYIRIINDTDETTLGGIEGLCYQSMTSQIIGAT